MEDVYVLRGCVCSAFSEVNAQRQHTLKGLHKTLCVCLIDFPVESGENPLTHQFSSTGVSGLWHSPAQISDLC